MQRKKCPLEDRINELERQLENTSSPETIITEYKKN